MEDLKQRAMKAGNTYYVYTIKDLFGNVRYVGYTRYLGRRINEHINALANRQFSQGIYAYMFEHNLQFFEDMVFEIVARVYSREDAQKIEANLILIHSATAQNIQKYDTRKHNTDTRLKPVKCVTTGETFWAIKPCCEKFNISRYLLVKAIENNKPISTGELFEYL